MASVFMKLKSFEAPQLYSFTDPDTGYHYQAANQEKLVQHIVAYRAQNGLEPLEALGAVLQNYWCAQPENKGRCEHYVLKRGFLQTLKGGIALLTNFMYEKFVSQEEAERRAKICLDCPHNIKFKKGKFNGWADSVAEASVGDRKTPYDKDLGNCAICSCLLKSKIFYGDKIELDQDELEQMPDFCWQKQEVLANTLTAAKEGGTA